MGRREKRTGEGKVRRGESVRGEKEEDGKGGRGREGEDEGKDVMARHVSKEPDTLKQTVYSVILSTLLVSYFRIKSLGGECGGGGRRTVT